MIGPLLAAGLLWETCCWGYEKNERARLWRRARTEARRRKRPLLVVGEPDGEYPCPDGREDILMDLRPGSRCPNYVRASIEKIPFPKGHFGAAFVSHVLEHVCRPEQALRELHRVTRGRVYVSYPRPWRAATYTVPGHAWTMHENARGSFTFKPLYRSRCNTADRYGTGARREGVSGFEIVEL